MRPKPVDSRCFCLLESIRLYVAIGQCLTSRVSLFSISSPPNPTPVVQLLFLLLARENWICPQSTGLQCGWRIQTKTNIQFSNPDLVCHCCGHDRNDARCKLQSGNYHRTVLHYEIVLILLALTYSYCYFVKQCFNKAFT